MARLLVLTDRMPSDTDWKGAVIWDIILSLCQSHHEVLVFTNFDPSAISLSHSRLTVARPVRSWGLSNLFTLTTAIFNFRPDVLHTFALKPETGWFGLNNLWAFLTPICDLLPNTRRFITLFEESDLLIKAGAAHATNLLWYRRAHGLTVFCESHRSLVQQLNPRSNVEILPLEIEELASDTHTFSGSGEVLIPAPVSEWQYPERALSQLAGLLRRSPDLSAKIVGGWGELPMRQRRQGWRLFAELQVAARVHLTGHLSFEDFRSQARRANAFWLEALRPEGWRYLVSYELARRLEKPSLLDIASHHPQIIQPPRSTTTTTITSSSSTANALSRLYSKSGAC